MAKFGYEKMFTKLAGFNPTDEELNKLALSMTNSSQFIGSPNIMELTEETRTSSSSLIPSGYVYLAQFIDHDISFDSKSDRFEHQHHPWELPDTTKIINKRKPFCDLETIYGYAKPTNKNEIARSDLMKKGSKTLLNLGETFKEDFEPPTSSARCSYPNDLPREVGSPLSRVVDPRNDSNLVLAQTQVAFTKFHNAIVHELNDSDTCQVFRKARKIAIRHYQYIILKDFLPKIIKDDVLQEVIKEVRRSGQGRFYRPAPNNIFIPVEFSVAAFRLGHSMIRNEYNWNLKRSADLSDLLRFTGKGGTDFNGIGESSQNKLRSIWIINWNWFYDFGNSEASDKNLNFAEPIDTKISSSLNDLIPHHAIGDGRANSIAALDLYRGRLWKLPTGQDVATRVMGEEALKPDEIESTFGERLSASYRDLFKKETPLFYYLLAESELQNRLSKNSSTLGNIGSRIVAEVVVKLLYESPYSILKKELESDDTFLGKETGGKFGMPEMLNFMAKPNRGIFDEINPITDSSQNKVWCDNQ